MDRFAEIQPTAYKKEGTNDDHLEIIPPHSNACCRALRIDRLLGTDFR